ncbi:hypothetical protein [Pseudomonas sp. CGJS7]|uniref:hypothetical protein n=1 Tax=Pseudomonas sp. CGJS7 TaxID=3109348 RepID=UPI00300A94E8
MNRSDREKLQRLTNVQELLGEPPREQIDVRSGEAVVAQPDPAAPAMRSTHDPLSVQTATGTVAEALTDQPLKPAVRWFAWIFLAWPPLILWLLFAFQVFSGDTQSAERHERAGLEVFLLVVFLVPALYWPYLLLGNKKRR